MAIERAIVIAKMGAAFKQGMSASRFLQQMRVEGLSYRRTDMLSDWRTVNEIKRKEGVMRFIRKDRLPSGVAIAKVDWNLSKEYMYKVKVDTQLRPGEIIPERFVNIMSDKPLTPQEIEAQITGWWADREQYSEEELLKVQVWTGLQRAAI